MLLIHPVSIGFRSIECPARHGPRNIVAGRLRGNLPFGGETAGVVTQLRTDARLT